MATTLNSSRRAFLTSVGAVAAASFAGAAFAQSQDPDRRDSIVAEPRQLGRPVRRAGERQGGERQRSPPPRPIFSPETIGNTEQAIGQYQGIVSQGGWPQVPDDKKLELGVTDPNVEALRKRLIVSGDLSPEAGISSSFDTYVDAALKRFQRRHGIPADGVTGKYTYKAMNVSAQVRLGQLRDQSAALPPVWNGFRPALSGRQHSGHGSRSRRKRPRGSAQQGDCRSGRPPVADRAIRRSTT